MAVLEKCNFSIAIRAKFRQLHIESLQSNQFTTDDLRLITKKMSEYFHARINKSFVICVLFQKVEVRNNLNRKCRTVSLLIQ